MQTNLRETKTVLRSILVSTSVVINVSELNNDFREQEGIEIPYKELGFDSLIQFLKSIPDVLLVDGDSWFSEVVLVESAKSAHVSKLVMKQKSSNKPGAFSKSCGSTGRQVTQSKNKDITRKLQKKRMNNEKPSGKPKKINHKKRVPIPSTHKTNPKENTKEDWTLNKFTDAKIASSNETKNTNSYDLGLVEHSEQMNKQEKCRSHNINFSGIEKQPLTYSFNNKRNVTQNVVPKKVQNRLQRLISDFPEGIWCTELPTLYKNLTGRELRFQNFGYLNLSYMCFDLENIFHCIKASSCDYKLYDARIPLSEIEIEEQKVKTQSTQDFSNTKFAPTMPEIAWRKFNSEKHKDVLKLGYKVGRLQCADLFNAGVTVQVVVTEIFDISKFWINLDNSKFNKLMSEMQTFHLMDKQELIPHYLLAEGLNCVVQYQGKFYRAVILDVMLHEDYLKVYYFDYGTVGRVSKSEVWFMSQQFAKIPGQAIRARLADIYPPYEGVTWSPVANYDFSKLTGMKKLTAEIVRVDKHKNFVEIKLRNSHGTSLSDLLVDLKYASFVKKAPKKHEDPNCEATIYDSNIHLFPTFKEIENWVVPSMEETTDFINSPATADFLFSKYFTENLI